MEGDRVELREGNSGPDCHTGGHQGLDYLTYLSGERGLDVAEVGARRGQEEGRGEAVPVSRHAHLRGTDTEGSSRACGMSERQAVFGRRNVAPVCQGAGQVRVFPWRVVLVRASIRRDLW